MGIIGPIVGFSLSPAGSPVSKSASYLSVADDLLADGDAVKALPMYEKALQAYPDSSAAWSGKAIALYKLGKFEESIQANDRVLEIDPNFTQAWYVKGLALEELGKFEESIQAYNKAISIDPNYEVAKEARARALAAAN